MVDAVIRKADSSDIESLCPLYFHFHEFHAKRVPERLVTLGPFSDFDNSELVTKLKKILGDEQAVLLVAQVGGQIVGLAEAYIRQDKPHPETKGYRYVHLQSLMVREDFRGQGIGALLVQAAEDWARKHGAREIRLDTWEFSGDPVGFYEKMEYRTFRRQMVHVL
ncbi:MAG: hypothetical protein AMJ46_00280 [Latescibacteria bacterium DG_63]|nr:MAG: hypothetical protein AMJ46_00280 [Latescibacteria bacterium DG_63]